MADHPRFRARRIRSRGRAPAEERSLNRLVAMARKAVTAKAERPWRRMGTPESGFHYLRGDGKPLRSAAALARIRRLAIPPAWTDVNISPDADAKVQAYGTDAAGRKQYRYHPDHVARGSRRKYRKLLDYARAIPRLREARKNQVLACKLVSTELGNTPAVCRSAYIHPAVMERYAEGRTIAPLMREVPRDDEQPGRYYPEEAALMRFLQKWG